MIFFFFFNDTATTEIYTLSLHDALPICSQWWRRGRSIPNLADVSSLWTPRLLLQASSLSPANSALQGSAITKSKRSEEHTSELQSRPHLVCRLLLEKKTKYYEQHNVRL